MLNQIYNTLTQKIIDSLDEEIIPWRKPYGNCSFSMPLNIKTRKPYNGINILLLWMITEERNYDSHYWGTKKTWENLKAIVKEGEISSQIYFYLFSKNKSPFLATYDVYNLNQVSGFKKLLSDFKTKSISEFEPVERLINNSKAKILFGSVNSYYDSDTDIVYLPHKSEFRSQAGYYTTVLHELSHWTSSRLKRKVGEKGTKEYAFEELVAELSSCFSCASLGVPQALDEMPQHVSYIKSWIEILQENPKLIMKAASIGQKSTEFLLKFIKNESDCGELTNKQLVDK